MDQDCEQRWECAEDKDQGYGSLSGCNPEERKQLRCSDYVNLVIICIDVQCHGIGYVLIASFYPIEVSTTL